MLPDLSALPTWAQILVYTIFGLCISIVGIITMIGHKNGQKSTPSAQSAQVAAVIVDSTALNHATSSIKELSDDVRELTRSVQAMTLEMARNASRRR